MGNAIESDIYIGSDRGTISCYTSEKHIFLVKKAHDGIINCIKVTDMIGLRVLTCGEDAMIKIWDPSITLIQQIDLRVVNPLPDLNNQASEAYVIYRKRMEFRVSTLIFETRRKNS